MRATGEKIKSNKISVVNDFETREHPNLLKRYQLIGLVMLIIVISLVGYGVYRYKLRSLVAGNIAEHLPLSPNRPPQELTSFPIRYAGNDLTPRALAYLHDTLFVAFVEQPIVQLYDSDLALLATWRLQRPDTLIPTQIAVTDSFFVASDTTHNLIGIYDHEGFYVASVAWYPERSARVNPAQISVDSRQITVVDDAMNQVASISLLNDAPFFKFLELLRVTPSPFKPDEARLSCAWFAPDSNLWLGTSNGKAVMLSLTSGAVNNLDRPSLSQISDPIQFVDVNHAIRSNRYPNPKPIPRVHMLDRVSGKVFVYDLSGKLTLVYPQDRGLEQPLAIAVNQEKRHIYIAESGRSAITVFGF